MIWCDECLQATKKGGFPDRAAHDRHTGNPWNGHKVEEIDLKKLEKARWMLFCPLCMDAAASGTPEAGFVTKHQTIMDGPHGEEVIECSACKTRYTFSLDWTFGKKAPKPAQLSLSQSNRYVYVVRPDLNGTEVEVFGSQLAAADRIREIEAERLRDAGYKEGDEEGEWTSPFGATLSQSEAIDEAMNENGIDVPEEAEEVVVG